MLMHELIIASWQTFYMTMLSGLLTALIGIPLGIVFFITKKKGIYQHKVIHQFIAFCVNTIRSIPFIILLVALLPFTRFIIGTSIGTMAAIIPLSIGAIPFMARMIQNVLIEVPSGLIEAGIAMGATTRQIICNIVFPEALPGIIHCLTVTLINLVGYSSMAGVVGGGGLGDLAIRYGYQRFDTMVIIITIIILLIFVQLIQWIGDSISKKLV
ncbi:MAG: D-methionine transport system permease protein MetI [Legionellaceae bacterium]